MPSLRWLLRALCVALLLAWACLAQWEAHRRLPPALHIHGSSVALRVEPGAFLYDLTAADAHGAPLRAHAIDAELLRMIGQARELLVLDTGLFGDLPAAGPDSMRLRAAQPLAAALVDALVQARAEHPALQALLLVDPGSLLLEPAAPAVERLRAAGVAVVAVDAARLRAPNAAFAGLWRLCCAWLAAAPAGLWPNPAGVGPAQVSLGLWGRLQRTPRSHRQVLLADDGAGRLQGLVFSRALHAEAALHSATALRITGAALAPLLESELVVAQFSGWSGAAQAHAQRLAEQLSTDTPVAGPDAAQARVVSEGAIGEALASRLNAAGRGDAVELAALYLSERGLVRAILDAARRGAAVRVLLDPGREAYGYPRGGLPNRAVASELVAASDGGVRVRWYRTHGELFSPGFALVRSAARTWLMVGTAEWTRRDLQDCDLAAAFVVDTPAAAAVGADALRWFDTLWFNRAGGGIEYSSDADVYTDASQLDYWRYRWLEASGAEFD